MDEQVKAYINQQVEFKKKLLKQARELLIKTIPNSKEEFNWGVPVYDGGKFYIAAMKTRIHIGFAITGLSPEEVKQFEGSGKTMRHLKIHSAKEFDPQKIKKLIKLVHQKITPPPDYKKSL